MMSAVHGPTALNSIAKSITMPTREQLASPIQACDLPAAIDPIAPDVADEPRPLAAKSARGPSDRHPLMNGLPILAV